MVTKLDDEERIALYLVNDAVFRIDAAGPVSRQAVLQGFRFPRPFEWSALNITNEGIDAFDRSGVGTLPEEIVVPGMFRDHIIEQIKGASIAEDPFGSRKEPRETNPEKAASDRWEPAVVAERRA